MILKIKVMSEVKSSHKVLFQKWMVHLTWKHCQIMNMNERDSKSWASGEEMRGKAAIRCIHFKKKIERQGVRLHLHS